MPKLNTILAGLALSTAVAGGALAFGATAASADTNDNCGNGGWNNCQPCNNFCQPNNNECNNNNNCNQNCNNNWCNDNCNNCWQDNNCWWNQSNWRDCKDDNSAFGIVAKDVAIGFQDKESRDNNWNNNCWWQNNCWNNNQDNFCNQNCNNDFNNNNECNNNNNNCEPNFCN
jgi:hypothetical protein